MYFFFVVFLPRTFYRFSNTRSVRLQISAFGLSAKEQDQKKPPNEGRSGKVKDSPKMANGGEGLTLRDKLPKFANLDEPEQTSNVLRFSMRPSRHQNRCDMRST